MIKSKNNLFRLFEIVFSVTAIFHLFNALLPLVISGGVNEGDGISPNDIDFSLVAKISLIIYLITFILLALRWKKVFFYHH